MICGSIPKFPIAMTGLKLMGQETTITALRIREFAAGWSMKKDAKFHTREELEKQREFIDKHSLAADPYTLKDFRAGKSIFTMWNTSKYYASPNASPVRGGELRFIPLDLDDARAIGMDDAGLDERRTIFDLEKIEAENLWADRDWPTKKMSIREMVERGEYVASIMSKDTRVHRDRGYRQVKKIRDAQDAGGRLLRIGHISDAIDGYHLDFKSHFFSKHNEERWTAIDDEDHFRPFHNIPEKLENALTPRRPAAVGAGCQK